MSHATRRALASFVLPFVLACPRSSLCGQSFADVTDAAGLGDVTHDRSFRFHGTGMCAGDFDGDGDVDLVVGGNAFPSEPHRYFRNDGQMTFTELTATAGLGASRGATALRAADVDNDGDLDLFVSNWREHAQLFLNDGAGRFVDEAVGRGLTHVTSAHDVSFADYDRDGWVDVFVANRFVAGSAAVPEANILYRNLGGGHFVDVTAQTGTDFQNSASFMTVFIDANGDGWPDLYSVNDKGTIYAANRVLVNVGGTHFVPDPSLGMTDAIDGMGMDYVDAFNDGGLDYFVSDCVPDHLFRVWREDVGHYVDMAHTYGVDAGLTGWAAHFADFDNDRWFDLHVVHSHGANHVYRNPGRRRAAHAPWEAIPNPIAPAAFQYTCLVADFDDDGRVDLLQRPHFPSRFVDVPGLVLQRNVSPMRHWIKVRLEGTTSHRDALGARVRVSAGGVRMQQVARADTGYLSGSDRRLHFGLADATRVDRIEIVWPSGQVQRLHDLSVDRVVTVREPKMELVGTPQAGGACIIAIDSPSEAVGSFYAVMLAMQEFPHTPLPDGRVLPIRVDALTGLSLTPGNAMLHGNVAQLHRGRGGGLLTVPDVAGFSGLNVFATAVTFDANGINAVMPRAMPLYIH